VHVDVGSFAAETDVYKVVEAVRKGIEKLG
jgi:hypothetical protein